MSHIRLSPRHGVNPMLENCFYCGKTKGVALLGMLRGDAEAPRAGVLNHEPCDACADFMRQGIILISIDEKKTTDQNNPYRTGGFCVVKEEAVRRFIRPEELVETICKKRVAFLPGDTWDALGLPTDFMV